MTEALIKFIGPDFKKKELRIDAADSESKLPFSARFTHHMFGQEPLAFEAIHAEAVVQLLQDGVPVTTLAPNTQTAFPDLGHFGVWHK